MMTSQPVPVRVCAWAACFWLGVICGPAPAAPAAPWVKGRPAVRKAGPDQAGDSHVPGFPTTPARLTNEYLNAFFNAEADDPSVERMLHALQNPKMAPSIVIFLPRYRSQLLLDPVRKLAKTPDPAIQAGAIGGLIGLLDAAPETRAMIREHLRSSNPAVRGRAAEYLSWLGQPEDFRPLTTATTAEHDPYAHAAMVEASAAIKRRATRFGEGPAANITDGEDLTETYLDLAKALDAHPTRATQQAVLNRLRIAEPFDPIQRYPSRQDQAEPGAALIKVQRLVCGYPEAPPDAGPPPEAGVARLPVARTLIPPVRDFMDRKRKSYGILIPAAPGNPFSNKHHVGDDAAWRADHETVVAIGDGIVRAVNLGLKSWGGLVIVEHADPEGRSFCSLYGHLGPLVCVEPGQIVRKGQKLGAVGITWSHANGGYLAHIHFGIHRSAYLTPDHVGAQVPFTLPDGKSVTATVTTLDDTTVDLRLPDGSIQPLNRDDNWIQGYMVPERFNSKLHGWIDPQAFIAGYK